MASQKQVQGWRFDNSNGEFTAEAFEAIGRLYFPLANEAGMRSWVSPRLQGSPAASHNEYLGIPLSAEDLSNGLVHRGFWIVEKKGPPFSLSSISPEGLKAHLGNAAATLQAGPGWFRIVRSAGGRFSVCATLWAPADVQDKIELMQVEVTNTSSRPIEFNAYAAIPLFARSADNLRDHRHVTALLNRVQQSAHGVTVCPTMSFDERGHKENRIRYSALGFGTRGSKPEGIWASQEEFLGEGGSFAAPAAVWRREVKSAAGVRSSQGQEALGGFRFKSVSLKPGKTSTFLLLSGISDNAHDVAKWTKWARTADVPSRSLAFTKKYWADQISRISFGTPDPVLNHWLTWVNFQPILRRLYGNSYLPQFDYGRGGKGWRDLWQDCLALLLSDPKSVRPMLLHNFGGVRIDGSNATIIGGKGAFIADRNNIPRTWMDHGIWPLYTTLLYVDQTGDFDFLLQEREYFRDPQLYRCRQRDPGWNEEYGYSLRTRAHKIYRGTIFEHMLVQNLTAFFNVGEHNVCRLEGADWNDGLDMASHRGESVAFSAFYAWNLERLAQTVESLAAQGHTHLDLARELVMLLDRLPGSRRVKYSSVEAKQDRLQAYLSVVAKDVSGHKMAVKADDLIRDLRAKSRDLAARIQKQEFVSAGRGLSFFNGYYDDNGRRVEGSHSHGPRMSLTGQVFPVMSGIATDEQIEKVVASVGRLLKDPKTGGVRLNTNFGGIQPSLGRAFSFAYGEKENGAVFSHMAVMYAFSLYLRRRPEAGRAVWSTLYRMATDTATAKIFPGVPEYFNALGRGMYCYLTGSASWLIYLLQTQVFGVRGEGGDLVIDPQLTRDDFDAKGTCSIRAPFAGRSLRITFVNPGFLRPGRYTVGRVEKDRKSLVFVPRADGGIRLSRRVLQTLPTACETSLTVTLERKNTRD